MCIHVSLFQIYHGIITCFRKTIISPLWEYCPGILRILSENTQSFSGYSKNSQRVFSYLDYTSLIIQFVKLNRTSIRQSHAYISTCLSSSPSFPSIYNYPLARVYYRFIYIFLCTVDMRISFTSLYTHLHFTYIYICIVTNNINDYSLGYSLIGQ